MDAPAENEIAERTYTLENAMNTEITELYVYKSKGENLTPNGLHSFLHQSNRLMDKRNES